MPSRNSIDRRGLVAGLATLGLPSPVRAEAGPHLLYVKQQGCPYCARWEREIGPIYPRTPEARRAPLRPIDRHDAALAMLDLTGPVVFTPTFILISGDREVGRITGYVDQGFFWGQLERLLGRLPAGRPEGGARSD